MARIEDIQPGEHFVLNGHTGPTFRIIHAYKAAGFIPTVFGKSETAGVQTTARVEDIAIVYPCVECRHVVVPAGFALCHDCRTGDRSRQWKTY